MPETFRPALQNKEGAHLRQRPPLQPGQSVEGQFDVFHPGEGNFYRHMPNDSMGTLPEHFVRNPDAPRLPLHPRGSFDSVISAETSGENSVYYPRRVESIMGEEDRRKYMVAQTSQREAGGAYLTQNIYNPAAAIYIDQNSGNSSQESMVSAVSSVGYHGSGYPRPSSSGQLSNIGQAVTSIGQIAVPEPAQHRHTMTRATYNHTHSSPLARGSIIQSSTSGSNDDGDVEVFPLPPPLQESSAQEPPPSPSQSSTRKKLQKKKKPSP